MTVVWEHGDQDGDMIKIERFDEDLTLIKIWSPAEGVATAVVLNPEAVAELKEAIKTL